MAASRLGAFRTIVTALRTAVRPGSPGLGERVAALPRLVRATLTGQYTGTTRGRLLMVLGAIAYVVSPIDVVPEAFLTVFGLADDAVVVSWIAATLVNETESFLGWERSVAQGARERGAADATVQGHVVR
jgi:uncharacterized membrane protein YkvA (DUF1232 family)